MTPSRATVISALGVVEIFAWGSSFYLLAVLADPIIADTGWSRAAVTGGISLGLLASGAVAMRVGRLIGEHGGRRVLAAAMLLIALGLTIVAAAPGVPVYLAGWLVIGTGMGAGLYDAAFATLGRLYGQDARRAITALTLWGGFASTVCWPISALLVEALGWRGTCLAYAAFHVIVTMPLCIFLVPRAERTAPTDIGSGDRGRRAPVRDPVFWLLATAGTTLAMIAALWSVHLISILQSQGLTLAAAVALGALIGPSQVGARVVEMALGARHHPIWTMLGATILVAAGFAGLVSGIPAAAALIAYGAGNGIWSIARGTLPLAIFGSERYAPTMGMLASPVLIGAALAPSIGAILLERLGAEATLRLITAAGLVPILCAVAVLIVLARRRSRQP